MGRSRNPERDRSMKRYLISRGRLTIGELAEAAGVPKTRISKWKSEDKWDEKLRGEGSRGIKTPGGGRQQRMATEMPLRMAPTQRPAMKT